jgi:hypothetical protein
MGEGQTDRLRGIIVYPFLDKAIPLERVYDQRPHLTIHEKLCLEREVGKLVRIMNDSGIYPVDAHLDHFLAVRSEQGTVSVKYIDFERIHFRRFSGRWLRRVRLIRSLGRLLARLEWLRASGGRINRSAMMRMARACLMTETSGGLDKQLLRAVIRSAKKFWYRREFNARGVYEFRSFKPSG